MLKITFLQVQSKELWFLSFAKDLEFLGVKQQKVVKQLKPFCFGLPAITCFMVFMRYVTNVIFS